jgi:uncharacterized protein (TIGR02246 family)
MKANKKTEEEIKATLTTLTDAYASRDLSQFIDCFAIDDDVVLYGAGKDQKRIGIDQIRSQVQSEWERSDTAEMTFSWFSISAANPVAWAVVDGAFDYTKGGNRISFPVRASFVLEHRGGRWLIVHAHFSTPAAEQPQ